MRKALLLVVMLLAVTACGTPAVHFASPQVSVDTPALRALRVQAGIEPCRAATAAPAAHGLPDVTLPCIGGGNGVALARLRGPMVVNLWSQSCAPCRAELPRYQAFARKYAGRVGVLGIDWQDFQPQLALELAKSTGVKYPLVADEDTHVRAIGNVLPQLLLIDRKGDIAFQEAVEIKSVAQLEKLVHEHLGVSVSG